MRLNGPAMQGASLVEVLVAVLILSYGMVSVAALQVQSRRYNAEAGQRTVAAQLAYDLLERMRANNAPDALAGYVGGASPWPVRYAGRGQIGGEPQPRCSVAEPCTPAQLAAHDLWQWEQALDGAAELVGPAQAGGLPQPTACVDGPGPGTALYTITIAWRGNTRLPEQAALPCGRGATDATGRALYGATNEYRRAVSIPAFIAPRVPG